MPSRDALEKESLELSNELTKFFTGLKDKHDPQAIYVSAIATVADLLAWTDACDNSEKLKTAFNITYGGLRARYADDPRVHAIQRGVNRAKNMFRGSPL